MYMYIYIYMYMYMYIKVFGRPSKINETKEKTDTMNYMSVASKQTINPEIQMTCNVIHMYVYVEHKQLLQ